MESIRIIQSILTDFYLIVINLIDARYWVYEVQEREKEAVGPSANCLVALDAFFFLDRIKVEFE